MCQAYQSFPQLPDQNQVNPAVIAQPVSSSGSPGKKKKSKKDDDSDSSDDEKKKKTGMERLEKLGGVLVKQKADEMEDATGIEKENKYKVDMSLTFTAQIEWIIFHS